MSPKKNVNDDSATYRFTICINIFLFLFIATKGGKGGKGRPKGAHTPDKTPGDPTPGDLTPEEPEIRQSKCQPKPIGIAVLLASCKFYMVMH